MVKAGRLGVRGRLLLSFFGISGFSIIAAAAAFYSFSKAGNVLNQITQERLPPALASMEVSLQAERIIRTAPRLLAASSHEERTATSDEITERMDRLTGQMADLEGQLADADSIIKVEIAPLILGLGVNLEDVDFFVEQRIDVGTRKQELLDRIERLMRDIAGPLSASAETLETALKRQARGAAEEDPQQAEAGDRISAGLLTLLPRRDALSLVDRVKEDAFRIADNTDGNNLDLSEAALRTTLLELDGLLADASEDAVVEQLDNVAQLDTLLFEEEGLIPLRREELDMLDRVTRLLEQNTEVANRLQTAVNRLVEGSKANIRRASQEAIDVQDASSAIMIAVVLLSVLSATLITWLYVQRNLVARIMGLSGSMMAIAEGALRTEIPKSGGADEIDGMAEALVVFRDTAVEVEEKNLREVAAARQRLIDALESTSEGFAFYDAEDRLEIFNNRYRELLYSNSDVTIQSGMTFEEILRHAIRDGFHQSPDGDVERYVRERVARHQNPGQPWLMQRAEGRWVQISERRIEGGGTVAVYSDLTDLKQREQELASAIRAKDVVLRDLDAVLENIDYGALFLDSDLRVRIGNRAYRELWGVPEDILSRDPPITLRELIEFNRGTGIYPVGDDQWDAWLEERVASVREGGIAPIELRRDDGKVLQYQCTDLPDGGRMLTYFDITPLKQREAELARVSERLQLALSIDVLGIWDADLENNTLWWSPEYTAMLGHDPDSFVPQAPTSWEERLHPDEASKVLTRMGNFLSGETGEGDTMRLTQHMLRVDGSDIWVDSLMRAQRVDGGPATRLTGLALDITERLENERALAAMAEKQRLANQQIALKNKELETLSNKLAKYLSPQVYASIFAGEQQVELDSQRKKLTIFFSDIANFTETTDKMESEDLTQLLNHYLTEMSQVALAHGATIDKYVGDAIMIFFGDPESQGVKEDAIACVTMAIAMQKRVKALSEAWRDSGIERPLSCRIGIHTGYCTVGNFGSEDRMDYTIIGGAVNLASRLEHEAEPGGVLLSYETYAHVKDVVHCEEVGQIQVKGIAYPIATYRAVDLLTGPAEPERQPLRVELPHLELAADIGQMTAGERKEATSALENALARLSDAEGS